MEQVEETMAGDDGWGMVGEYHGVYLAESS